MNVLKIDTKDSKRVVATLVFGGKTHIEVSNSLNNRPESILKLIKIVCTKAKIKIQDIDEIFVEEGPGSYTGLKVGASVANALSFALLKKVNGKKIGDIVEPKYS